MASLALFVDITLRTQMRDVSVASPATLISVLDASEVLLSTHGNVEHQN
jgi:hypothetical protein